MDSLSVSNSRSPENRSFSGSFAEKLSRKGWISVDVHVIPVDDVLYMESADDYVAIHTADSTHIKLDRLNKLEQRLDPRQFCRIHRSYLMNISYLAKIEQETKDSRIATLTNGKELPISRSGYSSLKALL